MKDPDWEDTPFLLNIDFGKAINFITGTFPNYILNPIDNTTDPGVYQVKVEISDDNPNPLTSIYVFRIRVDPMPTPPLTQILVNQTRPK